MKGKRRSKVNAKKRNTISKSGSSKLGQVDTTETQERKISTRSSVGITAENSMEKETADNVGISETSINDISQGNTRKTSRNAHSITPEKNVYSSDNVTLTTIQTRRSTSLSLRWNKEANGDTRKMKDYVVTRSVTSKRESMKTGKNINPEKHFTADTVTADALNMESQQGNNKCSSVDDYAESTTIVRETGSRIFDSSPSNKESGRRESRKRERKEDETYKTYSKEKEDVVKRQKRNERKTNNIVEETYTANDEVDVHMNKEKIEKSMENGKEVKKEGGRVLRGRKELYTIEKEKRGRAQQSSYGQQQYNEAEKKNALVDNATKDGVEVEGGGYVQTKEVNDAQKYNEDTFVAEREKGKDKKKEKTFVSVNGSTEKPTERSRRNCGKLEGETGTRKVDKYSAGIQEGKEGEDELEKIRGKSSSGIQKKECAIETQHNKGANRGEDNGKYSGDVVIPTEKGTTKEKQEGREEKKDRATGKETDTENKNGDILKSSYIKNGRVLRNLNRYNTNANDNAKTVAQRNSRNDKSEVSLCNIITSRRKRKNVEEAHASAVENDKNKHNIKPNANNAANNATKRKAKKGKRNIRRGVTTVSTPVVTKTLTRGTAARNANAGGKTNTATKTNGVVSQHHERRGNHVAVGTSDIIEENRHRGAGHPHYTNNPGRVNVAIGTEPYNQPVCHSTRYRERQTLQLEEPDQKKRKKRVTEEGSKESSKINVGENYQVQTLPTFFLCRPELVYDLCDNSDSDENDDQQCFECAGLPCHCKSGEPKLVYSPLMLERVKERCLKSRGYQQCVKNEMELSAYVQECAKSWKTNTNEWIPFSPEYAYKLLHYANYDPLKAISIMKSKDFSFRKILDPPTRKYQNKWKPKDKRDQLSKSPFPSPLTIRNYLSKRHHSSGYHLR